MDSQKTQPYEVGLLVVHPKRPEWGPGRALEVRGSKVTVYFRDRPADDPTKAVLPIRTELVELPVAEVQSDPFLDNLPPYADAAPRDVKEITARAAKRLELRTFLVANQRLWVPPGNPFLEAVRVEGGPDVADAYIVEHAEPGDLAITADIPRGAGSYAHAGAVGEVRGLRAPHVESRGRPPAPRGHLGRYTC